MRKYPEKSTVIKILVVGAFLLPWSVTSQTSSDAGLWTSISLEHNINSRFNIFLTEEVRLKNNITQLNLLYTLIGIDYKITRNIKTSLAYRSTQKLIFDDYFIFRHRIQWDLLLKKRLGNIDLSYRHRLQGGVSNVFSSEEGLLPELLSRSRIQLKLDLSKPLTPYISAEYSYQIWSPTNPEINNSWYRTRYQAGCNYKVNLRHSVGLYYLIQSKKSKKESEDIYIIGIEYTFKV